MKVFKYFVYLSLVLLVSCNSKPEKPTKDFSDDMEAPEKIKETPEIESDRIAFLNRHLQLTPEEAKHFWPIYDQYNADKKNLWQQKHSILFRSRPALQISAEKANVFLDSLQYIDEQLLNLDKQLVTQLLKILPAEKVLRIYHAENRFRRHLMNQYRQKRGQRAN